MAKVLEFIQFISQFLCFVFFKVLWHFFKVSLTLLGPACIRQLKSSSLKHTTFFYSLKIISDQLVWDTPWIKKNTKQKILTYFIRDLNIMYYVYLLF